MGKKAREKKLRKERKKEEKIEKGRTQPFLKKFIFLVLSLTLFSPLIFSSKFYFPFVGPKSLFFMAGVEIAFFSWLILILKFKEYRPKINSLFLAFGFFLLVLIFSALFGVDFSRSFWSKFERMTGILMWLHLFALFLLTSSLFKSLTEWENFFQISVLVSFLISLIALGEKAGIEALKFSDRGGSTLGNTSFLGSYLLFNAFLTLWLFWRKKDLRSRSFLGFVFLVIAGAIYFSQARAASGALLGGIVLLFLFWLSFKENSLKVKIVGRVFLSLFLLVAIISVFLVFVPGSFVYRKFGELTTQARFVNWEIAKKAFLERPLLGWGPENYPLAFNKYFNPCLFIAECGGEIWFDRAHNIIFDTLVFGGIFGLLGYLSLFGIFYFSFWKKYFKEKTIDFWTFSIFPICLTSYFVQNLTVFDMPTSLMMFILILSLGSFLASQKEEKGENTAFFFKDHWKIGGIAILFGISFFLFIFQPLKTERIIIKALREQTPERRIRFYQEALTSSPLGKYQIREFFAHHSQRVLQKNFQSYQKEEIKKELDFLIEELKKTEKESPLDFRSILRLANLYNLYTLLDPKKALLAETYGRKAKLLSPRNQQVYWSLAQSKIYQKKFEQAQQLVEKAIELEPRYLEAYKIAIRLAQIINQPEKTQQLIEKALKINPRWEKALRALGEKKEK